MRRGNCISFWIQENYIKFEGVANINKINFPSLQARKGEAMTVLYLVHLGGFRYAVSEIHLVQ
jgi:hypothetical protein